ncbi:MAG: ATP12 family chaperone protein [Brevundimonas sp.]|jgi:chaperone required for assembly of F1-ATPase|uniref:ATP12 family chaperone protein n=1 Tax=Brevundimonas sp. TaxID=1871086 RepID=UPI00391B277F
MKPPARFIEPGADVVRRFWKEVSIAEERDGFAVMLDTRRLKTPAGAALVLPTRAKADMVADEWRAQGEIVAMASMPATRLAQTAIARVRGAREAVAAEVARYGGSDVICYLADGPEALRDRQEAGWAPWRQWASERLGAPLVPVQGLLHQPQDAAALERLSVLALELDDFDLAALASLTSLLGSAVLAFAVQRGALDAVEAYELSRIDELYQQARWGVDEEAAERTRLHHDEAAMLGRWLLAES